MYTYIGDKMKTIRDFDLNNKTVILRCDLNVPFKDNEILDDTRIVSSIETIKYILDNNARVIILSHLGKVKNEDDKKNNSLSLVIDRLNSLLDGRIEFVPYTKSDIILEKVSNLSFGHGILLENTRFEDLNGKLESSCDLSLAKYWASLGDIFINDAFGTIHRGHASNLGVSTYLESGIGFLVEKELSFLNKLDDPKRPFAVIMGGAKISDKLKIIDSFIERVDYLFIGGAMAYTFLKALGYSIGDSLYEEDYLDYCKKLYAKYSDKIILTKDVCGSFSFSNDTDKFCYDIDNIPSGFQGLDIGAETISLYKSKLSLVKTVFWNGPLGVYEFSNYREGTKSILDFITSNVETTILGGGDMVGAANELGYLSSVSFASTGGGATLEYLENKDLPGLKNIE